MLAQMADFDVFLVVRMLLVMENAEQKSNDYHKPTRYMMTQ